MVTSMAEPPLRTVARPLLETFRPDALAVLWTERIAPVAIVALVTTPPEDTVTRPLEVMVQEPMRP